MSESEVHKVLLNERRRAVLDLLRESSGGKTLADLAERIAELESGEKPAPRDVRHNVYVSLQQNHIPQLEKVSIVRVDRSGITLDDSTAAQQVYSYLETVPRYGLSWSEYYFALSVVGLLAIIASLLGVFPFSTVDALYIAVVSLFVHMFSTIYQTWQTGSSIVGRITD